MVEKDKRLEMFLRFEAGKISSLAKKFAVGRIELEFLKKETEACQQGNVNAGASPGTELTEEKRWYYRQGFLDGTRFIKSCARNYPERLASILELE